ncbi:TolC family protein [bacterium]|jgi:multidrug efflux pump subunit AcrB/outer membrane protein TolC|nr:TolC family protein [bacterium]
MFTLIKYFINRHFFINLLTLLVFCGGVVAWNSTNKEELPDITFNTVQISTSYSGASAEDVEFYVTKPLEESLLGINGVQRITSSTGQGSSSISVELDSSIKDIDKAVTEIQNQVSSVSLPIDVVRDPRVRVFETSKKAIIDIALYNESKNILDVSSRRELQSYVRGLENKLMSQPEIFEVRRSGYLKEEINIKAAPTLFTRYEISLNTIATEIKQNHVRAPAGTLKSGRNEQVTVLSELSTKKKLDNLVIQGGFDSPPVKLNAIASISDGFEDVVSIYKVNGREAILLNVVKNTQYGILDALDTVKRVSNDYQKYSLNDTSIKLTFLDDESIDVRNRLRIIASNGVVGFILILITLFVFLNKRSGFWVALGIPFTLCFTLICGYFLGYTINGVTLAAIIIVLGIVVDDAIIVAENITRHLNSGESLRDSALNGTKEVIAPILASILTTCAAFIPLLFFSGRFGSFVKFIPPVIFLMLLSSLLESFFFLPAHMTMFSTSKNDSKKATNPWFDKWESAYEKVLNSVIPKRYLVFVIFLSVLIYSGHLLKTEFKFVMFPRQESREIVLSGEVDGADSSKDTAKAIQPLEDYLRSYIGKEGVGVRSSISRGRRGHVAQENQFSITMEIVPFDEREKSLAELIKEVELYSKSLKKLKNMKFRKTRFGQSSGSAFEIIVQENDDLKRAELVEVLTNALKKNPNLVSVEKDVVPMRKEYIIDYDQGQLKRLSVSPSTISSTLRTILNGSLLYTIFRNDEEVDVKLSVDDVYRETIKKALSVPVENRQNYLVPLNDLVNLNGIKAKRSIRREDHKRSSFVYADLEETVESSPLTVADLLESTVFPKLLAKYPSSQLHFSGEVVDTRDSKRDLFIGVSTAVILIYFILSLLFNSIFRPLRIMLVIPFGIIGVILAFYFHGKTAFGFYAAIGSLGMLGVVVNDAIVMLNKLDGLKNRPANMVTYTASIAKTRLRAILLTTLTTVAGVIPTAYGIMGTDVMVSDMMIALAWGLLFGTFVTLILTPCLFMLEYDFKTLFSKVLPKRVSILVIAVACFSCINFETGSVSNLNATATVSSAERSVSELEKEDGPLMLSLDDFIMKAIKNDTTFHTMILESYKFSYWKELNVSVSELLLSGGTDYEILNGSMIKNTSLLLSKTFPNQGQSYSSSYTFSDGIDSNSSTSFTFSQDIARNAFGKSVQLDEKIEAIKLDIARFQLVEAYEDYMAELMILYYSWINQYEGLQQALSSFKENQKVLDSIKNRKLRKIANDTDVNKLELQILTKKEQVIGFETDFFETTRKIKRVINDTISKEVYPERKIVLDNLPISFDDELSIIQKESRTFDLFSKIRTETSLDVEKAIRNLLPSVSLSATILNKSLTYGSLGISFDLPLQNKLAKADYEVSKLESLKVDSQSLTDELMLITTIRNIYESLITQKRLIAIASSKREFAQKILDAESENYSFGKVTLNDYIGAVNRHDSLRLEEIKRKIDYQIMSVEWKRLTDRLIVKTIF